MEIWKATLFGFKIFIHWQVYVVGFGYFTLILGYNQLSKSSRGVIKEKQGFLSRLFTSILNVIAIFFFIVILAPIILGISKDAAWSYPFLLFAHNPASAAGFFLLIFAIQFFLSIFTFISQLPSFQTLVIGAFSLIYFLEDMITSGKINITNSFKSIEYMPHGIESLLFLVICVFFTHLGALFSMLTISIFFKNRNTITGPAMIIYALSEFVPVFIYGAWLGNQLTLR
jgi:hypothetical protein